MPYRRNLIDQLEVIKSLIQSGFTLQESLTLSNPPQDLLVPVDFAEDWQNLRAQILEGEFSALSGIQGLISRIELDVEVSEAYQKTTSMPQAQSYVCGVLVLGALALRFCFFDSDFQNTDVAACVLLVAATSTQIGIYRYFLRESWFHDWLKFIQNLENQIRCGKTPQQSLRDQINFRINPKIPKELLQTELPLPSNKTGPLEENARKSWKLICLAQTRGISLGQFIQHQRERLLKKLISHYASAATQLSLLMLVPLYFLFLPACLLVILGPLMQKLTRI
jgi:hypothetical protein